MSAIVKRGPLEEGLEQLSSYLSTDLAPPDLAALFEKVKEAELVVEHIHDMIRKRVIEVVAQKQNKAPGAAFKLQAGPYLLEVRTRDNVDPKRLEGMLRAKGLNPADFMDSETKYKVRADGIDTLLHAGHLSLEELESCRKSDSYTVMSPKRVTDE
jgi:hypothetical protein